MTIRVESLLFADDIVNCSKTDYTDHYKQNRGPAPLKTKRTVCCECQWNPSGEIEVSRARMTEEWTVRLIDVLGQQVQFYDRFIDQ